MTLFLFSKQIVDIFYTYRLPDLVMAVAALYLVLFQLWLLRPDKVVNSNISTTDNLSYISLLKKNLRIPDICILCIGAILLFHMIVALSASTMAFSRIIYLYGKIGSAFLLYFMGRLCYKRIDESADALTKAAYIIVYANLIYRFVNLGTKAFSSYTPEGDLYYYDTDLTFSILMALIFIAIFGKNTILKFVTIFCVCPFMIIHSVANLQKVLLFVIYAILLIYMGERAVKRRRFTDFILPFVLLSLIAILILLILPVFTGDTSGAFLKTLDEHIIGTGNLMYRYSVWNEFFSDIKASNLSAIIWGNGIIDSKSISNQYLSILYSTGIVGIGLSAIFITYIAFCAMKISDRKTYYATVMLAIIFLGTCMIKDGIEFTQMSWLVMMFFGMAVSGRGNTNA